MGQLVNGQWAQEPPQARNAEDGSFNRESSPLRHWVESDPNAMFPVAKDRYHLYVNVGCPWAYRTVLMRNLKGLQSAITLSCTQPGMGPQGWTFLDEHGQSGDDFSGHHHLHQVYTAGDEAYTGRVTVPVLWDKQQQCVVNNESSEIMRMLNGVFAQYGDDAVDYYPEALQAAIDGINERVYEHVNNGVYKAGFASSQGAYETAVQALFEELDRLEEHLATQRYLVAGQITEADWRLFSTLLRFDLAYYSRFRCNLRRIVDYPNLWAYARDLYQQPRVAETIDWRAFKGIYWSGTGIIPAGPNDDWSAPHGREQIAL